MIITILETKKKKGKIWKASSEKKTLFPTEDYSCEPIRPMRIWQEFSSSAERIINSIPSKTILEERKEIGTLILMEIQNLGHISC